MGKIWDICINSLFSHHFKLVDEPRVAVERKVKLTLILGKYPEHKFRTEGSRGNKTSYHESSIAVTAPEAGFMIRRAFEGQ